MQIVISWVMTNIASVTISPLYKERVKKQIPIYYLSLSGKSYRRIVLYG